MSEKPKVSRRGVYYDKSISPYEYRTPYGEILKFSSEKKLEMYTRDIVTELGKVITLIERHDLCDLIPPEIITLINNRMYKALYRKIEG